jgi:hypothetical protein
MFSCFAEAKPTIERQLKERLATLSKKTADLFGRLLTLPYLCSNKYP